MVKHMRTRREAEYAMMENEKLNSLLDIAISASSRMDLEHLLRFIADRARDVIGAERCSVFMLDRERNELWTIMAHGMKRQIRMDADHGVAGYVMRTGEVLNINDAYRNPRFNRDIDEDSGYRTNSMLALPMKGREGRTIGVFEALNKKSGVFTAEDERLLGSVASIAAVCVQNAMMYQELTSRMLNSQIRLMAGTAACDG